MYLVPQLAPACFERLLFEFSYPKLSRELTLQGDPYPMLDELGGIMH